MDEQDIFPERRGRCGDDPHNPRILREVSVKRHGGWADAVVNFCASEKVKLRPGASLETIIALEKALDFHFPEDFVALYMRANGFEGRDWNQGMFSFWPLERIQKEYIRDGSGTYIAFCDYLINSHTIGFFKEDAGVFKDYNQIEPVACCFRDAVNLINANAVCIY